MLRSVWLLSHGRGVRQHPQPQKIGQAHLCHFCPFPISHAFPFSLRAAGREDIRATLSFPCLEMREQGRFGQHRGLRHFAQMARISQSISHPVSKDDFVISMGQVCGDSGSPPTHPKHRKPTMHPQSARKANEPNFRLPYFALPYCPIALLLPHARQSDGGLIDILATWPVSRNRLSWLFTRCCLWARSTKR